MRRRIMRQPAVKTELSAPCRKMLRVHFSALIPLAAGTDFHYRDIISLSTHMAKEICAETRFLFISPQTHTASLLHLNLVTFLWRQTVNSTAVILIYCIFSRWEKLSVFKETKKKKPFYATLVSLKGGFWDNAVIDAGWRLTAQDLFDMGRFLLQVLYVLPEVKVLSTFTVIEFPFNIK